MSFPAGHDEEVRAAIPGGRFITGLENLRDEHSELSEEQRYEYDQIFKQIKREDEYQKDYHLVKDTVLRRELHVHIHSALDLDLDMDKDKKRTADVILARKAPSMARHEIRVLLLNLNFFKRLHTRALYTFMKEDMMMGEGEEVPGRIELKIQEEEADEVDLQNLMNLVNKYTEEAPLIVLADETCKEVERLDDAILSLSDFYNYYHFWSCSVFAHGTPWDVPRFRPFTRDYSRRVKEVIDLIDIDDEDQDAAEPRHVAVRQIDPYVRGNQEEGHNIHERLRTLPVHLISHINHENPDVWDCDECGHLLAKYLKDEIKLCKEGTDCLERNKVFIVGSIERFQSSIIAQQFMSSLLRDRIPVEVAFGRRMIRIEEKIKTMKNVVLSDNISVRGVDKKIVIIVPSHGKEAHDQEAKDREQRREFESLGPMDMDNAGEDEEDVPDTQFSPMDTDITGEDEEDVPETQSSPAAQQSLLRRAINHYNRADRDLILDMLKDAPYHAVLFHFANERLCG